MGKQLDRWHKAGRFVTGIAVACFFLPFFGVSCGGMEVVSISGADMVGGCKPGGLLAEGGKGMGMGEGTGEGMGDLKLDKVAVEPLAIASLALVLAAAGFAWVRTRKAVIASLVLSIAAIGSLGGLYVKVNRDMTKLVDAEMTKQARPDPDSPSGRMTKQITDEVDAGGRMGLWLTVAALLGAIVLAGMALRGKQTVAAAVPGGPPGGPPPGGPWGPPPAGPPPGGPPPG